MCWEKSKQFEYLDSYSTYQQPFVFHLTGIILYFFCLSCATEVEAFEYLDSCSKCKHTFALYCFWFKHILLYQYTKGLGMAILRHKPSPEYICLKSFYHGSLVSWINLILVALKIIKWLLTSTYGRLMFLLFKCRKRLLWGSVSHKRLNGSKWN